MKLPKIPHLISSNRLTAMKLSSITSSKHLLKYAQCTPHSLPIHHLTPNPYPSPLNPNFINFSIHNLRNLCSAAGPEIDSARYGTLEKKLKTIGIDLANCKIGEKNRLICPECEGGDSMERSFSLYITPDANLAMWQCYRAKCGWRGHVRAFEDDKAGFNKFDENDNVKRTRIITEESIGLEPRCSKVVPGELTIVTGVPNSGKSEWIDALFCNNECEGWKFALCSMENKVREHARKLLEKHVKKPFFNAGYSGTTERMTEEDFERGKEWLDETFHLIMCEDDSLPSITWVLTLAKAAVFRHRVRGLVIDLYSELDLQRPPKQMETEYFSEMLTKIKCFAQQHACHVWFVAHPRQVSGDLLPDKYNGMSKKAKKRKQVAGQTRL